MTFPMRRSYWTCRTSPHSVHAHRCSAPTAAVAAVHSSLAAYAMFDGKTAGFSCKTWSCPPMLLCRHGPLHNHHSAAGWPGHQTGWVCINTTACSCCRSQEEFCISALRICFVFWHSCQSTFMHCKLIICFTSYSAIRTSFNTCSHGAGRWERITSAVLSGSVRRSLRGCSVLFPGVLRGVEPPPIWRSWRTVTEVTSKSIWPKSIAISIAIIMIIASIASTVSTTPHPFEASSSSLLWYPLPAPGLSQGPGHCSAIGSGSQWLLT